MDPTIHFQSSKAEVFCSCGGPSCRQFSMDNISLQHVWITTLGTTDLLYSIKKQDSDSRHFSRSRSSQGDAFEAK